jgi:hypothetical protein
MNLIISLLSGFITNGITPPGLLNMTAAKVNLKEGKKCLLVRIRCSDNYFFQAYLAIVCTSSISTRYSSLLREVGWDIGALTVYFFVVS